MKTAAHIRILIANDLVRCDEIAAAFESLLEGDERGRRQLVMIGMRASRTLQEHQRELAAILSTASQSAEDALAGALVPSSGTQSGSL